MCTRQGFKASFMKQLQWHVTLPIESLTCRLSKFLCISRFQDPVYLTMCNDIISSVDQRPWRPHSVDRGRSVPRPIPRLHPAHLWWPPIQVNAHDAGPGGSWQDQGRTRAPSIGGLGNCDRVAPPSDMCSGHPHCLLMDVHKRYEQLMSYNCTLWELMNICELFTHYCKWHTVFWGKRDSIVSVRLCLLYSLEKCDS